MYNMLTFKKPFGMIKKNGVKTMEDYFERKVCSQCIHKKKENCCLLRMKKEGTCTIYKCQNYKCKKRKKTGEYKIEQFFTYRFLRANRTENKKEFTENYYL